MELRTNVNRTKWIDEAIDDSDSLSMYDKVNMFLRYSQKHYKSQEKIKDDFLKKLGMKHGWVQEIFNGPLHHNDYLIGFCYDALSVLVFFKYVHGPNSFVMSDATMTSTIPTILGENIIHDPKTKFGFQTTVNIRVSKDGGYGERLDSQVAENSIDVQFEVYHEDKSGIPGDVLTYCYKLVMSRFNQFRSKLILPDVPKKLEIKIFCIDHGATEEKAAKDAFPDTKLLKEPYHSRMIAIGWIKKSIRLGCMTDSQGKILS